VIDALCHLLRNSADSLAQAVSGKRARTVKIAVVEEGENLGISIADRGEGILRKNLDQIFEPFFSTRPDHVGLGLTFVKRVMEEHGGKIRVESQKGKGTKMSLTLPKDRRRKVRRELVSPEAKDRALSD